MKLIKRNNIYHYVFMRGGVRYRGTTSTGNKRVAEAIMLEKIDALAKGKVGIVERRDVPTLKSAMDAFLAYSAGKHAGTPSTHKRAVVSSVALLKHFEPNMSLDSINVAAVDQFKIARLNDYATARGKGPNSRKKTKRKISPATVNRELALLRMIFNFALRDDTILLRTPFRKNGVEFLDEDDDTFRVMTYKECEQYLSNATPALYDVASLILETGMRPGEVCAMEPRHLHLDEAHPTQSFYSVTKGKTKAARRRVSLTTRAVAILTSRLARCQGQFLFPHELDPDKPMPKINNAHDRARKAANIGYFRLYDFRHTWATRCTEAGVDAVTLAAKLGHSKLTMVLRYAHPGQEHQNEATAKLEKYQSPRQAAAQLAQLSGESGQTIQ
jgi:integrase